MLGSGALGGRGKEGEEGEGGRGGVEGTEEETSTGAGGEEKGTEGRMGEGGKGQVVLLNKTSGLFRISTINSVHVPLLV